MTALSTRLRTLRAVSYTHLDVYKRQTMHEPGCSRLVAVDVEEALAMVEA